VFATTFFATFSRAGTVVIASLPEPCDVIDGADVCVSYAGSMKLRASPLTVLGLSHSKYIH
jgi:hypothetical protein